MDISIFGYNFNLEILILIGVVYLILVSHTVCGTCNVPKIMEGLTDMATNAIMEDASGNNVKKVKAELAGKVMATQDVAGSDETAEANATPVATTSTEGFTGANINYGESSMYDLNSDHPVNTSSWSAQNMTVVKGQPLSAGVKQFLARPEQKLPLPEGEMDFLANSQFKPECCPSTYSTGSGCWCGSSADFNYLKTRGGNNVPYSEY
jgi:hypothetical protein